jgi:hypothetical protein
MPSAERQVLTAPDVIARTAARMAPDPMQRWMLGQPRSVRRSFAEEVFEHPDEELLQEVWMLRQDDAVRESFVEEVLLRQEPLPRQEIWMLRQGPEVRESYVDEVLLAEG